MRRQARTVALDPDEVTSTTWAARTPDGTLQVAACGAGDGFGDGRGDGLGVALRVVVLGFGFDVVVVVVGVVVEPVALPEDAVVEVDGAVVGPADSASPPPHAATSETTSGRDSSAVARAVLRLIGRSAGSRGCSRARPTAGPGW